MKLIIFTVFVIGISFAEASLLNLNLGGLLDGAVDLVPALIDAGNGFKNFAKGINAIATALQSTNYCDLSEQNKNIEELAENTKQLAKDISNFAKANVQETNDYGQLALLSGDLSEVTNTGHGVGNGLNAATEQLYIVADDIIKKGLQDVHAFDSSLEDVAIALIQFNTSFANLTGVSKLLLNTSTAITGLDRGVHDAIAALKNAIESANALDERCNVSSGLPKALGAVLKEGEKTVNLLKLLNLS